MPQNDFIKNIAKYGLENDQEKLLTVLNELIEHSKKTKKINFALQLQSLLKEAIKQQETGGLVKVGSPKHYLREEDKEVSDFIIEKLTSDYSFNNLVCSNNVKDELQFFIQEHKRIELLRSFNLPVSNKAIFYGPSGCGKTLAAYVLAGELKKMMVVVNLGAIVSSKLGETSKNISKVFRKASLEDTVIFLDEFDSLGKIRDYNQDHGEMKRVVNTILQLFDYLPQDSIVVAATNHVQMIDEALLRRFDLKVEFSLPDLDHIKEIIKKTLESTSFHFDNSKLVSSTMKEAIGLSYYSIQKTLITAIKKGIFENPQSLVHPPKLSTEIWHSLILQEKQNSHR
jgi:SpoVK/Ycf46/Vps4 family AAA+-type ATPase